MADMMCHKILQCDYLCLKTFTQLTTFVVRYIRSADVCVLCTSSGSGERETLTVENFRLGEFKM